MEQDKIFAYCERGTDPSFWAEPLNAVTNAAFVIAGLAALWLAARTAHGRPVNLALSLLVVVIGLGSFAFHTLATRAAAIADVAPIGVFMLSYFALAMGRFLRLPALWAVLATLGFAGLLWLTPLVLRDMAAAMGGDAGIFLRGTAGYLPALLAMAVIGALMRMWGKASGRHVLAAACVFTVSLTLRALDPILCEASTVAGYRLGTHFVWHLLNALTLFLLMLGAIRHGPRSR